MLTADLIRLYPRLLHMTEDGSWPSIERHGLLSASALRDKWNVASNPLASAGPRRTAQRLSHPTLGDVTLRDQKPINEASLAACLVGLSVPEWLRMLDDRVFFFVHPRRLDGMLMARSYRNASHTVITIDTASLVQKYESQIELCAINSGVALPHIKARRGEFTYQSISDYRHIPRTVARDGPKWDISELCIVGGVPDIKDFVVSVDRRYRDTAPEPLLAGVVWSGSTTEGQPRN